MLFAIIKIAKKRRVIFSVNVFFILATNFVLTLCAKYIKNNLFSFCKAK
jgi:hypothetical protein